MIDGADKMILGKNAVFSTNSRVTGVNNNVIVCGGSGCGKTMSVSEPLLLEAFGRSLVVTVTKRRIVEKYTPMLRDRGYIVEELNFANPEKSTVAFDPLDYIRSTRDITFLAQAIVKSNPRKESSNADPYWDEASVSLLSAEIGKVRDSGKGGFPEVLEMHKSLTLNDNCGSLIGTSLDDDFEELEEEDPTGFTVSCWRSFKNLPIKTASCIYGTLNVAVDTVFTPELLESMKNRKKVDFISLASKKTVLFVTTSAVNPSLNCFVNLFYSQVFKSLFEFGESRADGRLPIPVHVLCDDFATGSRILNFPEYISIFREKGISVTLLVQSESQLEGMYGQSNATTIINNCDTYVYMGGMDLATSRSVSTRANLPLEDILYMPIGREFIFRRGQKPIITERYDIECDDRYTKITDAHARRPASSKSSSDDHMTFRDYIEFSLGKTLKTN